MPQLSDRPQVTRDGERERALESLFTFPTEPYRRSTALLVALLATAALFICSMPLPWHHHIIPAAGYTVVYGIQGANWLLVVAAICWQPRSLRPATGYSSSHCCRR